MDDALVGGGIGFVAGALGGVVAAVLVLRLRHLRNALRVARGRAPYRDCVLPRMWRVTAPVGLVGGTVAGHLAGAPWSAATGAALPVLLLAFAATLHLGQVRRAP